MNDTVTILGRVGADPNRSETTAGVPVVNFRIASPQRRYDAKTQAWIETGTNWYNVSAFRQLADHAKASLRQGDGVIVTGRLKLREWETGGRKGMSADIEAETIGHDLRWGASAFVKATRPVTAQTSTQNGDGVQSSLHQDSDAAPSDGEQSVPDDESDRQEDHDEGSAVLSEAWTAGV